jgi:uncharacterized protein
VVKGDRLKICWLSAFEGSNPSPCIFKMRGIKNLDILLKSIKPELSKETFVFCTVNKDIDIKIVPKMIFREKEGATLILRKEQADKYNLKYDGDWSLITLNIHSDLNAVGFLAKITERLAKAGISVNAVSAYYHDHLFIPNNRSKEALKILSEFSIQPG